ncbi:MAG: hypothetical protein ABIF87_00910 [Pseudomonadota bacterium]
MKFKQGKLSQFKKPSVRSWKTPKPRQKNNAQDLDRKAREFQALKRISFNIKDPQPVAASVGTVSVLLKIILSFFQCTS